MEKSTKKDAPQLLQSLENSMKSNAVEISRIGARTVVLCKFADAVLPQLTAAQARQVAALFRQGVEDAMACADDIAVPGAYHTTLLEQTNVLLAVLEMKGVIPW
jgi:hypothetical protein